MFVRTGKPEETWFNAIFAPKIWSNIKKEQIASLSTECCWQSTGSCKYAHSALCEMLWMTEVRLRNDTTTDCDSDPRLWEIIWIA